MNVSRWIMVFGLLAAVILPAVSDEPVELTYVGAERCKMCHARQYQTWSQTPMSKAWDRVKDAPDVEKCLPCHTTGYGQPGGFVSLEATPNLTNVQCEACHGPASRHMATPMTDRPARRAAINIGPPDPRDGCRRCHNPHVLNPAAAARGDTEAAAQRP